MITITTVEDAVKATRAIISYLENIGQGDEDEAIETAVSLLDALVYLKQAE